MAVLTVKKSSNQFADLSAGWKEVTIVGAKRGQYDNEGTKYIDITFDGYPENVKLRAHQKFNKKTNEEFVVLSIFRNANAGIKEVAESEDGEFRVEINDDPANLIGQKLNVYFYKNAKGYTDISDRTVATVFKNALDEYTQEEITKLMKYTYENRIKPFITQTDSDSWNPSSSNGSAEAPSTEKEEGWG